MIAHETLADVVRQELAASFPDRRLLGAWMDGNRARNEHRTVAAHRLDDFEALCREVVAAS